MTLQEGFMVDAKVKFTFLAVFNLRICFKNRNCLGSL